MKVHRSHASTSFSQLKYRVKHRQISPWFSKLLLGDLYTIQDSSQWSILGTENHLEIAFT